MDSYFTKARNVQHRLFFIFGNTEDLFCDDSHVEMTLEQYLHKQLKNAGYERIIFHSKEDKLYSYDIKSFELIKNKTDTESVPKQNLTFDNLKNPIKGTLKMDEKEKGFKKPINRPKSGKPIINFGYTNDTLAYERTNFCMKDSSVRTAVVYTNAADFIQYYGNDFRRELFDNFKVYDDQGAKNKNIMIFI